MADPRPLVQARDPVDAEQICEELRAAGIKCGWRNEPDVNSPFAWIHATGNPDTRLEVYVDVSDLDRAHEVLAGRRDS